MTFSSRPAKYWRFWLTGLGSSLLIAGGLSSFASSHPDGLNRVALDHGFDQQAAVHPPSHRLPFYHWFDGYALRPVPTPLATPLAGIVGTLVTFSLAWGVGKITVKPDPAALEAPGSEPPP
ncbi:MAG: PDGLE domain-containing protein [Cyanobacteria bacterium REEB459]|nr:PDGLE domain-containing protein [Cyanobacteria bacterium REEB459]